MSASIGKESVMLLFDVIIPVPHCTLQWGLGQVSNNVGITISLPISHANSGYKILVTHYNGVTPDSVVSLSVGQRKESDFYVSNKTNDNPAFFWFTIGQ